MVVGIQNFSILLTDEIETINEDKQIVEKLSIGTQLFKNDFDKYCEIKSQCDGILEEIDKTMMQQCPNDLYENNIKDEVRTKRKELIVWAVDIIQDFSIKCGINPNYKVVKKTATNLYKETCKKCDNSPTCSIEQFEYSFKSNFLEIVKTTVKNNYKPPVVTESGVQKETKREFSNRQYALIAYYLNKHKVFRLKELPNTTDKVRLLISLQNLPLPSRISGSNLHKIFSNFLNHGIIHSYANPQTDLIKDLKKIQPIFETMKLHCIVDDINSEIEKIDNQYPNKMVA